MEYIFANIKKFTEPIRILFLCGSTYSKSPNDKRNVLKNFLEKDIDNKVILLEKYFSFNKSQEDFLSYYDAELFDLYNIENLAALLSTKIIILHESYSTAGEIGTFASNPFLKNKIITLVPERYTIEEEKLSNFLELAFWHRKNKIIDKNVIRYYPITKTIYVSNKINKYYTYFPNNEIPRNVGKLIKKQIGEKEKVNLSFENDSKYGTGYNNPFVKICDDYAKVNLEFGGFKNYIISMLNISELKSSLRNCKKVYEVIEIFDKAFKSILKNTLKNNLKIVPSKIEVTLNDQERFNSHDCMKFAVYMLHACGLMNIKKEDNGDTSVHFPKNTSELIKKYSPLVKPIKPLDWGE